MFLRLSFVVFLLSLCSVNCVEFSKCICQNCYPNYTIGMEFDRKCFFTPLTSYSPYSSKFKYLNKYDIFSHESNLNTSDLYSENMRQIVMQLSARLKTEYGLNHLAFRLNVNGFSPSQVDCPVLDIVQNYVYNDCRRPKPGIFVANDYKTINKTMSRSSHLKPCGSSNRYFVPNEDRCFYLSSKNGTCKNEDVVFVVNSTSAFESLQNFALEELTDLKPTCKGINCSLTMTPKSVIELRFQMSMKNQDLKAIRSKFVIVNSFLTNLQACYKLDFATRRIVRTQTVCDQNNSLSVLCQTQFNGNEIKIEHPESNFYYYIGLGIIGLVLAVIIGMVLIQYFFAKMNSENYVITTEY